MSAFVLAALLAVESPTIAVDIDALALPNAQAEQLHGELMTRLVESGHPVGTSGAIVVRLTGGGARVHVEVQHGTRAWQRDVDGSGALLRLATIHAVLDLLGKVDAVEDPDPARASPPERSVFVEADAAASAWMPELIAALVEADNVVKPSREGASWRVCLGGDGSAPTIAVGPVDEPCPAGAVSDGLAEDVVVALATARAAPPERAVAPVEPAAQERTPEPESKPVAVPPPPTRREQAWSGALGVGAGAEGRVREAEALVLVHGDARHESGAMLTLRTEISPSAATDGRVVDTFVTAGAGYAFTPKPRLRIELVATAGLLVHSYRIVGDRATSRPDFTAALPITFAIRLAPRVELGLSLVAGVSSRPRSHFLRGRTEPLWSRDRFRLAGLVGLRILLGRKLGSGKMAGGT